MSLRRSTTDCKHIHSCSFEKWLYTAPFSKQLLLLLLLLLLLIIRSRRQISIPIDRNFNGVFPHLQRSLYDKFAGGGRFAAPFILRRKWRIRSYRPTDVLLYTMRILWRHNLAIQTNDARWQRHHVTAYNCHVSRVVDHRPRIEEYETFIKLSARARLHVSGCTCLCERWRRYTRDD
jgi:hypothetical protein